VGAPVVPAPPIEWPRAGFLGLFQYAFSGLKELRQYLGWQVIEVGDPLARLVSPLVGGSQGVVQSVNPHARRPAAEPHPARIQAMGGTG
jgi:hypothetical protein